MQIFRGSNKNPMVLYARERLPPLCPANLLAGLGTQAGFFVLTKNCQKATQLKKKEQMVCDKFLFLNKKLPYFAQFFCFWGVCFNLP
jgi:hypothetical protein